MNQRHQTLPRAQTDSAREAQRSFFCELCNKGYSRMNDYEAHLSSYDHSHKQRLRDMKQMVKDPAALARARKQEKQAEGLVSIKLGDGEAATSNGGGGFKKGGFKKTGFKSAFVPVSTTGGATTQDQEQESSMEPSAKRLKQDEYEVKPVAPISELVESDTEDEGYEMYDPRHPTD